MSEHLVYDASCYFPPTDQGRFQTMAAYGCMLVTLSRCTGQCPSAFLLCLRSLPHLLKNKPRFFVVGRGLGEGVDDFGVVQADGDFAGGEATSVLAVAVGRHGDDVLHLGFLEGAVVLVGVLDVADGGEDVDLGADHAARPLGGRGVVGLDGGLGDDEPLLPAVSGEALGI